MQFIYVCIRVNNNKFQQRMGEFTRSIHLLYNAQHYSALEGICASLGVKAGRHVLDIVLGAALAAVSAVPSFGAERHQFDVSAEDAQAAIQSFATQAQVQILVAGEQIRDKRLNSVSGDFSTDDALQRLLIGTGLTPQYVSDHAIALVAAPAAGFEYPSAALGVDQNDTLGGVSLADGRTKLKNSNFISRFITFLGSALGASTFAVHAQNAAETREVALEEIVVTAERRESNVQNTAASVSVRSGTTLMEQGKFSLGQILEDIPGISGDATAGINGSTTDNSGSDNAASNLIIRGIPSNGGAAGTTVSAASSAAIYVDGVYEGVGRSYDIDRVEVLRGPQGTLYGRSATSGVVAIHTRNPELHTFGGNASVELGSYDLQHYTAALNLPAGDALALRVSANRYERDGYYGKYNPQSRDADGGKGGSIETTDARVKLLYSPNSDLNILFGFAMQDNTNYSGGAAIARSSNRDVFVWQAAPLAKSDNAYRQYWAEVNWNLGFGTLTYQPAFRTWTQDGHTISSAPGTGRLIDLVINTPKDDFWTHELRLSSNPDSSLIWQAGVLYYDNDLTNSRVYSYQDSGRQYNSADTQKSTEALGAFAQATYPFTDASRLTAGARYDHTEVATSQNFFYDAGASSNGPANITRDSLSKDAGTRRFDNWTYTVRGEHDLSVRNLIYGSVSTGFSPGEVSLAVCLNGAVRYICPIVLEAETLTAYEIGSKNRFLDDRLQLNGAVFYYDYGAFQTGLVNVNINPLDPPTFATLAAPVKAYGTELEMLFQITAADRLGINLGYTHAYYVDKPALFASAIARDTLGDSPFTANLSYDRIFNIPGGSKLTLHGDVRYLSARDGALNVIQKANGGESYVRIGAETIGNVSTTWTAASGVLSLTAWVRNVGDNVYPLTVTLSGNTQPFGFTQILNEPRTYGAAVNVKF